MWDVPRSNYDLKGVDKRNGKGVIFSPSEVLVLATREVGPLAGSGGVPHPESVW
jgi:hypothetical protein